MISHPIHLVRIRTNSGHILPFSLVRQPQFSTILHQQPSYFQSNFITSNLCRTTDVSTSTDCEIAQGKIDIGGVVPYSVGSDERWPHPDYISIEEQKRQCNFELKADEDLLRECCEDADVEFLLFELIWNHIREDREFNEMLIHEKILYS
ncbi:unnamed protein product [Dimorphilus gyrociliatus]|uniref:Uncharacterized protein n=1 Tax=Dimorphilus gyrociliatus TaxID=2664684 RepID=A0A7I8VG03_9ANNE|nr:unnamed protein product [Dimorphilus gyrociliatus]